MVLHWHHRRDVFASNEKQQVRSWRPEMRRTHRQYRVDKPRICRWRWTLTSKHVRMKRLIDKYNEVSKGTCGSKHSR